MRKILLLILILSFSQKTIATGTGYPVALTTDGVLWSWGENGRGQLGDGATANKNAPVIVHCSDMLTLDINVVNVTCPGMNNGSATAIAGGGTAPYTYLWSNGKTTASITDLAAGTYTCTITDAASLSITKSFDILQPVALTANVIVVDSACGDVSKNGSLTVNAFGGTLPYQYAISNNPIFQESNVFPGLPPGAYPVLVKDKNGCIVQFVANIQSSYTPPPYTYPDVQTFNSTSIVANLKASGISLKWYSSDTETTPLDLSTPLRTGKYYVSQTLNGCESAKAAFDVSIQPVSVSDPIPTDGLVAYYPFNGNANDVSGNRLNASVAGATLTSDRFGNNNSAYSFNGTGSYIDATIANIPQGNAARTISGWFKTNTPNPGENGDVCIFNYGALSRLQRFGLTVYSKGYLQNSTGPNFTGDDFYVNNFNYLSNDWYFFTITYNGTKASLYVNGVFVSEKNVALNTANNLFRIGRRISGDTTNEYFKGEIDDIAIWNRVLTPEEISALYTPGEQPAYTLIPDPNFEQKLINLGLDNFPLDGKIHTSNINTLTSLDVSKSNISDLTGIQDFAALTNLNCSQNSLTTLNISKNTALTTLDCNTNRITSLDVSNNIALLNLSCYSNQLTSLNVKANTALTKLDSGSNQYTSLDVSSNTALTFLGCNTSQLTSLDVSNNTALNLLDCRENKLTSLDLTKITTLTELYCQSNQLTNLNLSKNKVLEFVNCSKNQLTTLDVSANTSLVGLYPNSNQLTSLNLKNGNNDKLVYLNFVNNPNLTCIQVDDVAYANANWSSKKDLTASFNTNCNEGYTLIPDLNFENKLISLGLDSGISDGKVLTVNIATVKNLDVKESAITDLTGIEAFKELVELNVDNNQLQSLNLSSNVKLLALRAEGCQLKNIDLKVNTLLEFLLLNKNELTTLDLSSNTKLTGLHLSGNKLKNIDLKANTSLQHLSLIENELTILDLSSNTNLIGLLASKNKLTNIDLKAHSLLQYLMLDENELTTLDVSANAKLYWLDVNNNKLTSLNIKNGKNTLLTDISFLNNTYLKCIKVDDVAYANANWSSKKDLTASFNTNCNEGYTLIPDLNFEKALIAKGIDSGTPDGKVLTAKVASVTELFIMGESITNLSGIQDFKSIKTLFCDENQITSIDLSNNIALEDLSIGDNKLTALDVSKNVALKSLYFHNNQIDSINVSKNTALQWLYMSGNKVKDLNISKNTALVHLTCSSNLLTALDLSQNTALEDLICDHNQIRELDISKNILLNGLYCNSNKLTALNTSKNTNLVRIECDSNQITHLDTSNNPLSGGLNCSSNLLTTLDISKNTSLDYLKCASNQLISLNLKNGNNTKFINTTMVDNLKNNPKLTCIQVDDVAYANKNWMNAKDSWATYNTTCAVEYVALPDTNLEQKLIDLGIDTDGLNGKITIADATSITSLDLSNSNIKNLTGIEHFTSLTTLDISNNQITTLDVSNNLLLETLDVSSNQLTTLDLSKNTRLRIVYVVNNPLVYLNLRNGNNANFILPSNTGRKSASALYTTFLGLTSLSCIQVDDENYSNANWSNIKESTTTYSNTCKSLGIDQSEFSQVIVYPNPTKGEVTINNIALDKATVYNSLGQLVKSFTLNNANTNSTIDLSGLPRGVYYVYLINGDAASVKKIIVE